MIAPVPLAPLVPLGSSDGSGSNDNLTQITENLPEMTVNSNNSFSSNNDSAVPSSRKKESAYTVGYLQTIIDSSPDNRSGMSSNNGSGSNNGNNNRSRNNSNNASFNANNGNGNNQEGPVIPAKAGIQESEIPAFTGMTSNANNGNARNANNNATNNYGWNPDNRSFASNNGNASNNRNSSSSKKREPGYTVSMSPDNGKNNFFGLSSKNRNAGSNEDGFGPENESLSMDISPTEDESLPDEGGVSISNQPELGEDSYTVWTRWRRDSFTGSEKDVNVEGDVRTIFGGNRCHPQQLNLRSLLCPQ